MQPALRHLRAKLESRLLVGRSNDECVAFDERLSYAFERDFQARATSKNERVCLEMRLARTALFPHADCALRFQSHCSRMVICGLDYCGILCVFALRPEVGSAKAPEWLSREASCRERDQPLAPLFLTLASSRPALHVAVPTRLLQPRTREAACADPRDRRTRPSASCSRPPGR